MRSLSPTNLSFFFFSFFTHSDFPQNEVLGLVDSGGRGCAQPWEEVEGRERQYTETAMVTTLLRTDSVLGRHR